MIKRLHSFGACRKAVLYQKSVTEQNLLQGQGKKERGRENGEREERRKQRRRGKHPVLHAPEGTCQPPKDLPVDPE